ncbi:MULTISPECIES: efflux RND transporter periplasmic adaptor subunit [Oceanospirillaceae]|uniref:efflux RND transporter periplasmic adaptor subunit n=1 Tax=Oceanospirillaceae TaxID=135620 RepID=UPI0026E407F2|nr:MULTISPECIES: efflux RND transporter periplasmic adaptor subunit [unclassified Oceanobacter]MDO6680666.1 efflux RND transporter periplasmic adaptor subunit [Oceanobacter sp. 5_MG-2023]MDP2506960.1 efflux RND transporter periplasmic adaptor subunit [Oceanobacter sp. 3_MG-2023]MDP2547713.1 efflux RND transporter periplasmic adaptor subunit [Oceanobacter sp. 4_MG-2023]|tara:strand:+ start:13771 stop:14835 length:1065 start_codon:yes stop_codon:yes gene_type:complete
MNRFFTILITTYVLSGCSQSTESTVEAASDAARWVKIENLVEATKPGHELTGTVKARHEVELAFQVGGKVDQRLVDAGQSVKKGEVLFTLDLRDLRESVVTARANLRAAEATLKLAEKDLERDYQLVDQGYTSRQEYERALLTQEETQARRDVAEAQLSQALNMLEYGVLRAESDGIILDVFIEPGEVVSVGRPVAKLAKSGEREVEVDYPSGAYPPEQGGLLHDGEAIALTRREMAGAADPESRTWKTRYTIDQPLSDLRYGQLVRTRFLVSNDSIPLYKMAISALDERGETPFIWTIVDGEAVPLNVDIQRIDKDHAWVTGSTLEEGLIVISSGTHLLKPGMAVQSLDARGA